MIQPNPAPYPEGPFQPQTSLYEGECSGASAEYYLNTGKTLYKSYLARASRHDLDAAVKHFQKAVEMEPCMAEAYVRLAAALWEQGTINLELAQFYCQTALKLDPAQSEAHLYLGYFLQRAGFLDDAAHQYRQAVQKDFWRSARARIALSNTLLKQAVEATAGNHKIALAVTGLGHFAAGCAVLPLDRMTCSTLWDALVTDARIYSLGFLAKGFKRVGLSGLSRGVHRLGTNLLPKEPMFYHMAGDDCLYDLHDPLHAIIYYEQALLLEPGNMKLLKKLGQAYADVRQHPKAVETLSVVVDKNSNDFDALYRLGQVHIEENAYMKALYYFKEATKLRPRYPYVHSNMAYALYQLDDLEGAYEEYKIAVEFGTDPVWLSTVSQTLGVIALQHYQNHEEAFDYLQQSLQFNPENIESMAILADLYFETHQFEMAISAYKTILQAEPENADCYNNIGYILWQMDRNQDAIDAYMAAIYYDPLNYVAHNNLGVIYLDEENDPDKALPLFKIALEQNPNYTLACFNVARSLEAVGETLEAAERYSKALQLNQLNPELADAEIQERIDRLFD